MVLKNVLCEKINYIGDHCNCSGMEHQMEWKILHLEMNNKNYYQ